MSNQKPREAKLQPEDVRAIRRALADGASQRKLGEQYGVGRSTIASILHRRTWAHLGD